MAFAAPSELTTERLEAELCQQAAHLDAALCRWLLVLAEFDRREAYGSWECRSAAHFLNWRCGISLRTGREHVRVARALGNLPAVVEAFGRGALSYSKVRAITRIATPETEAALVELASHMTAAHLDRVVRGRRFVSRRDAHDVHEHEHLRVDLDDEGRPSVVRAELAPDDAALLVAALERVRRDLESELSASGSAEPFADKRDASESADKPRRPTTVDALRAMCETVLAHGPVPCVGPTRTRVVVHVHAESGRGHLHDGPELALDTVRRLCCDAGGHEVKVEGAYPFDLGRRSRQPSQRQRLFLMVRDGGCTFPGCPERRFVDAHHVIHWLDGGPTDVTNLVLACRRHHRAVHEGGYSVALTTTGARWCRPDRSDVPRSVHPPQLDGPAVAAQNDELGLGITPDTPVARWDGSDLDVSWCVEGLLSLEHRVPSRSASDSATPWRGSSAA
jgi:hypothetical protein